MDQHQQDASSEALIRQRATLADFGLFAFRCHDLDELLHRATELVSEALHVDLVKVLEHRPERKDMLFRSGVNWQPGVVGQVAIADDEQSPGGYALMRDEPVISRDVATEDRFEIPEVLIRHGVKSMVNVVIAGESGAYGVLEVDAQEHRDFGDNEVDFLRTYANLLAAAIERTRLDQERERNAREQSLLARELSHRVRNALGLVQAVVSQTATARRTVEEYREAVLDRIQALAASESLVFEDRDDMGEIRLIAEEILRPYGSDRPEAVKIEGEDVALEARKGRMLGLALHELATNAAKYGALSLPDGYVRLSWEKSGHQRPQVILTWEEVDGPAVSPPGRKGFGSRLLEDVVGNELDGSAELNFRRDGLFYRLAFPDG